MSPVFKRVGFCIFVLIALAVCSLEFIRALRFDHGAVRVVGVILWGALVLLTVAGAARILRGDDLR